VTWLWILLAVIAIQIILGGFLAGLAHLAKLRDQRAADGVNWSFLA
jgi:hypothetical protein